MLQSAKPKPLAILNQTSIKFRTTEDETRVLIITTSGKEAQNHDDDDCPSEISFHTLERVFMIIKFIKINDPRV